ncbi:anaphase-promoting complex subunit cdh1 [Biomphalaria pfeifferi]|uniref:Glycosyltransferase family 92 protein n=1 Tax=Biomphalaria pfeifferi TaxID=112525 RepID=A0AAD8BK49_BIOPF|nr:anaphase-promoting complex subunit cdh1 [Biomphalaria pfeifferi]
MSLRWIYASMNRWYFCAGCLISSFFLSVVVLRTLQGPVVNYAVEYANDMSQLMTTLPSTEHRLRVVTPGENLRPGELEVYLPTAVFYPDFPARNGFNLFMNGWVRHKSDMSFKCCLLRTLPSGQLNGETFTEVQAWNYHEYDQWLVDMQSAEFSCSISRKQIDSIGDANFTHVTFAETSCLRAPRDVMKIIYPPRQGATVGLCLKISYDHIDPQMMVEWFEYQRLMNVTKVFTYTFDLDKPAMRVFEFYQKLGFLEMQSINPAKSKFGPKRGYKRPRFEQQAWVDEVMAANDCKHRMSGYDYVIVMDIDEYIVPHPPLKSYYDILKEASKLKPNAGAFGFDSHVVMLDWGATRKSPLNIMRYVTRTTKANYDGVDRNSRWAFMPMRIYYAKNNQVIVRNPYTDYFIPHSMYTLLHYRFCKKTWTGCRDRERTRDDIILPYENILVQNMRKLPLDEILYNSTSLSGRLRDWSAR